ncbi:MAG: ECF-type sigma factor [Pseudomonadota bacterium]
MASTLDGGTGETAAFADAARRLGGLDAAGRNALIESVHAELADIAGALLRREFRPITMTAGDLVNEAVVRLLQARKLKAEDRAHMLALSARIMRRVLIDAARRKQANKRAAPQVTLTLSNEPGAADFDLTALDVALRRLTAIDPNLAEIVEYRYFGGMTVEDVARAKGVSEATVKRSWRAARAWLRGALADDPAAS